MVVQEQEITKEHAITYAYNPLSFYSYIKIYSL